MPFALRFLPFKESVSCFPAPLLHSSFYTEIAPGEPDAVVGSRFPAVRKMEWYGRWRCRIFVLLEQTEIQNG